MTSTTVDALKSLYVARGGSANNVANLTLIPDVINALATLEASGATKELPSVSAANDGEVLTVVNGVWAAAALPENAETTDSEITG